MTHRELICGFLVFCGGLAGVCAAGEKVAIRYAPAAGARDYVKTTVEQKVTRVFMGVEEVTDYVQGFGEELEVLRVDEDGTRTVRATYRWIKYSRKAADGEVSYDSAKDTDIKNVPLVCLGYAAIVGQGYVFQVTATGEIIGVAGLKHMGQRIRAKLPDGPFGDELMRDVKRYADKETVLEMLETGFALYPEQKVAVGDKWSERSVQFQEGGGIRDSDMTLAKLDGDVAEIAVKSRFSPNPKAEPVDFGDVKATFELTGTETGTIRVDVTTGVGLGTKLEHELTGYTVLRNPDRPDSEVPIPLTIKGKTTIEVGPYEADDEDQGTEEYVKAN